MASRQFYPSEGNNGPGVGHFEFSFLTNGTGAIDATSIRGKYVTSVTRSAAGTYDVVLDAAFVQIISALATTRDSGSGVGRRLGATVGIADETASPLALKVYTTPRDTLVPTDYGTGAADTTATRVGVRMTVKTSACG